MKNTIKFFAVAFLATSLMVSTSCNSNRPGNGGGNDTIPIVDDKPGNGNDTIPIVDDKPAKDTIKK